MLDKVKKIVDGGEIDEAEEGEAEADPTGAPNFRTCHDSELPNLIQRYSTFPITVPQGGSSLCLIHSSSEIREHHPKLYHPSPLQGSPSQCGRKAMLPEEE